SIGKADASIDVSGYSGTYDGQAHVLSGTATGVNGEDLSSLLNLGDSQTNAGHYDVTWTFAGNANYQPTSGSAQITVARATLTVTAADAARAYGAADPALTVRYRGFVHNETPASTGVAGSPALATAATGSPLGTYAITPGPGSLAAANYDFTFADGTLTVTPAPLAAARADVAAAVGVPFNGVVASFANADPFGGPAS